MLLKQSHIFLIICASFIFSSCTRSVSSDKALAVAVLEKAGDNRGQLERVIEHYKTIDADAEKLAAAYYLIANLDGNTGYAAQDSGQYRRLLDSLAMLGDPIGWDPYLSTTARWLDSMNTAMPLRIGARNDLRQITANYLVANIDDAFEQWHNAPWAKEYPSGSSANGYCRTERGVSGWNCGDNSPWVWRAATKIPCGKRAICGLLP